MYNDLINTESDKLTLAKTTKLSEAPDSPAWNTIRALYKKGGASELIATLLNAIMTDRMPIFFMSYRLMEDLVSQDPNRTQGCSTRTYKHMTSLLINKGFIALIMPSTKFGTKGVRKAAVWAINHEGIIQELGINRPEAWARYKSLLEQRDKHRGIQ